MRTKSYCIHVLLAITVMIILSACGNSAPPTPTLPPVGIDIVDPPQALTDFALVNTANQPSHLHDLNGKFALMTFGYTHCPDICPLTLSNFKLVKADLGAGASKINFVFVSVDPSRDTPPTLGTYLSRFDPQFIGLTGDEATLHTIGNDYPFTFYYDKSTSQTDYTVVHTATWFLVDASGKLRRRYDYDTAPDVVAADIKTLLG